MSELTVERLRNHPSVQLMHQFAINMTLCQASYDITLSKHHSWIVRKLVRIATHLLASRDFILNAIIIGKGSQYEHEVMHAITRFIGVAEQVFHRLQRIYEDKNILNLS
ncbi:hypothetical protein LOAG_05265 [Loa loa]|uniref:Glycolipid transfer protein domain-containing protein n=1 Tax=Loa loa TaxID=7209 RepID=A0A1S0U0N9_LOALO|nr:hypothetical protein LOAG_05265 [Loa loa]EFO23220.1 hypothetical protein LOAG_05265 [Loa loa]